MEKRTVMQVLDAAAKENGDFPAMKIKRNGAWQSMNYREYREQARLVARAFISLGLQKGQGVSIIGFNCPEWMLADVGAILAGGVPAGIYTTNTADQCQYIADHSDAAIVVCEDAAQLGKLMSVRKNLPKVKTYVLMNGTSSEPGVITWDELLTRGNTVPESDLESRISAQTADDVCTLIYTSGTTGPPKAVMITHDNITWTAGIGATVLKIQPGDATVSYLPLSHIAAQITDLHGPMSLGATVWFAESLEKLGDALKAARPHYFLGVPRVWEKIQAKMQATGAQNSPLKKKIAAWARKQGLAGGFAEQEGKSKPLFYSIAQKLVFSKVREALGLDRCRMQVTSAAPIARDTLEFFLSLGLPIYEVYGMSECTGPATMSLPEKYKTGKAGFVIPGGELKIAPDGEVLMRGRHVFKGYLKNEEATREAIDSEGWLHSGDIGTIDEKGFLQITDRKKDILITAGGENVAPQIIEGELKSIPVISQAVVIGDRRKYLTALLTLDPEKIAATATEAGSPAKDIKSAATCATFNSYLQSQIDRINQNLARVQTIKKWSIITTEFTIDGGELTPTMKIKRKVIREKYATQIESLYPPE